MSRHRSRAGLAAALVLAAGICRAEEPSVCDVAPSTITFALGAYRGAYLASFADGSRLGHSGWQSCPAAPPGRERSWEGCNFSLCDLPDGRYQISFADPPAAPTFRFGAKSGRVTLDATDLAVQVGFYGVDATGAHAALTLDLRGYALPWSIAHWPGPFRGTETHGRAVSTNGNLVFSLFPGVPYALRFGTAHGTVSLDRAGNATVANGGPLAVDGHTVRLRVARLGITPPSPGDWSLDATDFTGPQSIALPAGATVVLQQGSVSQSLALDGNCRAVLAAGPFKITAPDAADMRQTCP